MKAVCLFICLALAHNAAGSIFQKVYPQMDLIVQPEDYITTYQRDQLNKEPQRQWEQKNININPEQLRYRQVEIQLNKKAQRQREQKYEHTEQMQERTLEDQLRWHKQQELLKTKSSESVSQESSSQESQDKVISINVHKTVNVDSVRKYPVKRYSDERSSNERSSTERFSKKIYLKNQPKEYKNSKYAAPVPAGSKTYSPLLASSQYMNVAYADPIEWKGVQFAVKPESTVQEKDIEAIFKDAYNTMKHATPEEKQAFHQSLELATETADKTLNATEMLNKNQYEVEEHTIKTEDGYFLTMQRITPKTLVREVQKRPVVFLMHGLLGSADDWLLMGPEQSLAYMLADAGYDVWLGNARGNKYSRRHAIKHPAQRDFWQYSIDEIAMLDLPTMIDYALATSGQHRLHYVGHGLGTTVFFALAATRPEYNDKIIMMHALSPMAYMSNTRSPMFRMIAPNSPFYEQLHSQLGHGEFQPSEELIRTAGGAMCENEIGCKKVCSNVNFVMSGVNVENLEPKMVSMILSHLPAGASTRQMKQYAKAVASHEFTRYDYGAETNERVYGQREPPRYNMTMVQAPVALYYSEADWLAHPMDVARLRKELPVVRDYLSLKDFSHMDFQFSHKATQMIYKRLIASIQGKLPVQQESESMKQKEQKQTYSY